MHTSLNARDHDHYETEQHSNLRGLITLLVCAMLLVGLAYAAMIMLTAPDSWMAEATLTSFRGEAPATIVATAEPMR